MRNYLFAVSAACILELTSALATAASAQAQDTRRYAARGDHFYQEPEEAPQGLRFADLEASMGTDPLTWSSDPGWQLHRTPANQLVEAAATLQSAIPDGTSAQEAAALLHKAGARCGSATAVQLVCGYRDAQTPYGGQYFDNVQWRVWLDLADGRVSHLTVTRDWTRR